jgi:CubicO group peptidase (beta-lactamase class C family)
MNTWSGSARCPLVYPPGEYFIYNTASDVAGVLIARVSGMALDRFLETKIFDPLGMTDTGFWVPPPKRARLATYYRGGPGTLVPMANSDTRYVAAPAFPSGAAGLVSTVDDYLAFARMLLNKGEVDGARLLSRKSVELMTTNQMTDDPAKRLFVSADFWRGSGFGLGLMVTTERLDLGPSVGSFWWNGATGVTWTADPHEDLIFLNFIQRRGTPSGFSADYMQAVYQAIVD